MKRNDLMSKNNSAPKAEISRIIWSNIRKAQYLNCLTDKQLADNNDEDFIVNYGYQFIKNHFDRLMKKNGIKMTFHDLRHLNASIMLKLGIPNKYAMERGGWSTDNVLKSVYQHTFSDERKLVDDKIDKYFNNIVDTIISESENDSVN